MKTTIMALGIALISVAGLAQNKNVEDVTKTTITKVTTSDGTKQIVKQENTKEVQPIELQGEQAGTKNIDMKESQPVMVTSTTKITNPDGTTRTVDVDRSSYYTNNGKQYKLALDAQGYTMSSGSGKPSLLRKTSTNAYVFRGNDRTAVGYFDTNGDLILEIYDDKSDTVTLQKYTAVRQK